MYPRIGILVLENICQHHWSWCNLVTGTSRWHDSPCFPCFSSLDKYEKYTRDRNPWPSVGCPLLLTANSWTSMYCGIQIMWPACPFSKLWSHQSRSPAGLSPIWWSTTVAMVNAITYEWSWLRPWDGLWIAVDWPQTQTNAVVHEHQVTRHWQKDWLWRAGMVSI